MKEAKLYILITVDAEDPQRPVSYSPQGYLDLKTRVFENWKNVGEYFGYEKIIEVLRHHNAKATFFVSVFECGIYGEEEIGEICKDMKGKGHDVQLHTHPEKLYDPSRTYMHAYTLPEQIRIIGEGKQLMRRWTGEDPIAHRAGSYGVDANTFLALKENAIPIDSSHFYGQPACKEVFTRNRVVEHEGVIEMPVTVFLQRNFVQVGPWRLMPRGRYIKTDMDWTTFDELRHVLQEAKNQGVKALTLFLHSYSLTKFDKRFRAGEPDVQKIEALEKLLHSLNGDPETQFLTMKEFYTLYQEDPDALIGSDEAPVSSNKISSFRGFLSQMRSEVPLPLGGRKLPR